MTFTGPPPPRQTDVPSTCKVWLRFCAKAQRAIIMMNTVKSLAKYGTAHYYYGEYGKVVGLVWHTALSWHTALLFMILFY